MCMTKLSHLVPPSSIPNSAVHGLPFHIRKLFICVHSQHSLRGGGRQRAAGWPSVGVGISVPVSHVGGRDQVLEPSALPGRMCLSGTLESGLNFGVISQPFDKVRCKTEPSYSVGHRPPNWQLNWQAKHSLQYCVLFI